MQASMGARSQRRIKSAPVQTAADQFKAKNYYLCSNRAEKQCEFICGIQVCGYDVTEADIKEVIANGQTKNKRDFIWKTGKKGTAYLALENGKVGLKFR